MPWLLGGLATIALLMAFASRVPPWPRWQLRLAALSEQGDQSTAPSEVRLLMAWDESWRCGASGWHSRRWHVVAGTGAVGAEPTSVLGQTATESTSCRSGTGCVTWAQIATHCEIHFAFFVLEVYSKVIRQIHFLSLC